MTTLTSVSQRREVRKAASSEAPRIAAVLSRAFFDDPVMSWAVPDDRRRSRILPEFFEVFTATFLRYEEVYLDEGHGGAALWAPPGQPAVDEENADEFNGRMETIFGADAPHTFELIALLDECHPHEPHYFLQFLGVVPEQQGKGIGSALLTAVLERCDRERLPAYLEATSRDSRRLYERHGFEATGEIAAAGGPPLWPMWRTPLQT